MAVSLRIAVADDEQDMREYLQRLLPRLGHQVVAVAQTGAELITACREHRPDLIITDVKMPVLNGDDAIRTVWEEASVPVIFLSAYSRPDVCNEGEIPFRSYLNKPVGRAELEAAIDSLVAGGSDA